MFDFTFREKFILATGLIAAVVLAVWADAYRRRLPHD